MVNSHGLSRIGRSSSSSARYAAAKLNGVLRFLLRAEHVAAEAEDRAAVALERDLERGLVARPDLVHQPLVAGEGEQPLGPQRTGGWCV